MEILNNRTWQYKLKLIGRRSRIITGIIQHKLGKVWPKWGNKNVFTLNLKLNSKVSLQEQLIGKHPGSGTGLRSHGKTEPNNDCPQLPITCRCGKYSMLCESSEGHIWFPKLILATWNNASLTGKRTWDFGWKTLARYNWAHFNSQLPWVRGIKQKHAYLYFGPSFIAGVTF